MMRAISFRRFKYIALAFIVFTLFVACGSREGPRLVGVQASEEDIARIDIPFRHHSHSFINITVLSSIEEQSTFVAELANLGETSDNTGHLEPLLNAEVDYANYNVLLFPITQNSGSIELDVQDPTISDQTLTVQVIRYLPQGGTTDMAYYALAYQINKNIDQINVWLGDDMSVIENRPGTDIIPKNCSAWFDGCNECSRGPEGLTTCTQKACLSYSQIKCRQWFD